MGDLPRSTWFYQRQVVLSGLLAKKHGVLTEVNCLGKLGLLAQEFVLLAGAHCLET